MTDIYKEREAFEAHFPRPTKYKTLVEQLKLYEQWHNKLEGWQARAKQHSGEVVRPVAAVLVKVSGVGSTHMTPATDYYTKPQQPQGQDKLVEKAVAEALEKAARIAELMPLNSDKAHLQYRASDDSKAMSWDIAFEIRNLINQPTTKESEGE